MRFVVDAIPVCAAARERPAPTRLVAELIPAGYTHVESIHRGRRRAVHRTVGERDGAVRAIGTSAVIRTDRRHSMVEVLPQGRERRIPMGTRPQSHLGNIH